MRFPIVSARRAVLGFLVVGAVAGPAVSLGGCDSGSGEQVEQAADLDPSSGDVSACEPDCGGKQCGDDGCGGTCGVCGSPNVCGSDFTCGCVPQCGEMTCGPDPVCGVVCGECDPGSTCFEGVCAGCGAGACGGGCGDCPVGATCVSEVEDGMGSCVPCGASECGLDCGPCPEGLECVDDICVGDALSTCTDVVLCVAYCDDIDEGCIDGCYAAAAPGALQDMTQFLDCSTAECGGLPSGEYNACVQAECTELYLECMTGDGSCVDFMPCLFDCTDAMELSGEKDSSDAYDYCFVECNVQMTLDDQKANVVFLQCLMETCPDVTSECLDEAFGFGGACYPVLLACKGSTELCEESQDCPSEKYCLNNGCMADLCDQGFPLCDDGDVYLCAPDGSGMALQESCYVDEDCVDGECITEGSCESDDDCAVTEFCDGDVCAADLCEQGTSYCKEGDLYACNVNGATEIQVQECGDLDCIDGGCQ